MHLYSPDTESGHRGGDPIARGRPYLTATATDAAKGTSEFSAVYERMHRQYLPIVRGGVACEVS